MTSSEVDNILRTTSSVTIFNLSYVHILPPLSYSTTISCINIRGIVVEAFVVLRTIVLRFIKMVSYILEDMLFRFQF